MSKNAKMMPGSSYADWEVLLQPSGVAVVGASRMERDKAGGYTFTARDGGITADFPPGTAWYVLRLRSENTLESGSKVDPDAGTGHRVETGAP